MTQDELLETLLDARLRLCAGLWPVLRDTHAIEDIFQITLLRAIKEVEKLEDENHAIAWARVTSRRLAIDHIRKHHKRFTLLDESALEVLEADFEDAGDDALADRLDHLKVCVAKLPPRSRRLLDLRYQERRCGDEIADLLQKTRAAIYQSLYRIHIGLRDCIERRTRQA